jgi:MraZ protein
MFIGEYSYNIDPKKRIAIPSKFREDFSGRAVITRGLDKCLFVYPIKTWEDLSSKLGSLPMGESGTRSFVRLMLAGAVDVDIDKFGRVLIPDYLKEYAGLKKEVVIAGLYNRLEIWDSENWKKYKEEAEKNTDEIAEQLGKLGIY